MDCSVCCETTKCIECPYCNFASCITCTSTFLLGLSKDSYCMSCNKLWTRDIINQILPKSFVNGKYKFHRENILFEREKSLFPETQPIIVREKRWMELKKIKNEIIKRFGHRSKEFFQVRLAEYDLRSIENNYNIESKVIKKKFVRKCPVENCLGFLSTSWKCSLCTNHICKDCNEIKGESHTCDPGLVETVKLLAKDTKPCPKCGEMIFKASGCSQMWCTSCHTVFDWNTMLIDTGIIHNPHYYEFARKNGTLDRQPGDVPCGGNNNLPEFRYFMVLYGYNDFIGKTHRLCIHLGVYTNMNVREDPNLYNRKKFMHGQITEYQFKVRIQRSEKAREKNRDVNNIMVMFENVLRDILIQLYNKAIQRDDFEVMIINIVNYTNDSLRKVKTLYDDCVMQFIDIDKMEIVYDSPKRVTN